MRLWFLHLVAMIGLVNALASSVRGQLLQYPQPTSGLRDIQTGSPPVMVPLNPATQSGLYPSTGAGSTHFDPYATRPSYQNPGYQYPSTSSAPPVLPYTPPYGAAPTAPVYPNSSYPSTTYPRTGGGGMFGNPPSPSYSGSPNPYALPGAAMPATTFPPAVYPGGVYPPGSAPAVRPRRGDPGSDRRP